MAATTFQDSPYAGNPDETNDDTTVGSVNLTVSISLVGTIAQVQADWATLVGTAYASQSAVASYAAS